MSAAAAGMRVVSVLVVPSFIRFVSVLKLDVHDFVDACFGPSPLSQT